MYPNEALRLFSFCEATRWSCLPVAGGVYDQHPELIEKFLYIFHAKADNEKRERQKAEAQRQQKGRRRPQL